MPLKSLGTVSEINRRRSKVERSQWQQTLGVQCGDFPDFCFCCSITQVSLPKVQTPITAIDTAKKIPQKKTPTLFVKKPGKVKPNKILKVTVMATHPGKHSQPSQPR